MPAYPHVLQVLIPSCIVELGIWNYFKYLRRQGIRKIEDKLLRRLGSTRTPIYTKMLKTEKELIGIRRFESQLR